MIRFLLKTIDSIFNRLVTYYRRQVFYSRTKTGKGLRILGKVYINATNIKAGNNLTLYPGVYFWGDGEIIIGNNVDIGVGTVIYSKRKVYIGDNVAIAGHCYIIDSNHSIDRDHLIREQTMDVAENGIYIGDDVWIGAGVKIIKGAWIHKGAVIGAMSLVNKEIKEYSVAFGIPAKEIKHR